MRHLRSFAIVAEELNITRAARRLHLAQQAVSTHVRQLEQALGARLLIRTSRGVELTAAGKELAAGSAEILAEMAGLVERVGEIHGGRRGTLRLLCKPHATHEFAVEVAEAMETAIPEVAIELITVSTLPDELGLLRSGGADVCFLWLPVGADGLSAEPVRRDRRMVALPSGHRLAARASVTLADLAAEPVIVPEVVVSDDVMCHWLAEPRPDNRPAPRGPAAQRVEDRLMLVARGRGVWLAPEPLSRYFPMPKITWLPVTDAAPSDLAVVWTPQVPRPLMTRLVAEVRCLTNWPAA
jgi:DNA-binding transcriptional LysR family regulator